MARVDREMPLNSIWEGAGNIMALDLLRALRQGLVAQALAHEAAPAHGAHAALDRLLDSVLLRVDAGVEEAQARRLARDPALCMQAVLLRQHGGEAVFEGFCASRLADDAHDAFQLPPGVDLDAVLRRSRASLHLSA
jgi:putative acyl-CoA dehydrogenase